MVKSFFFFESSGIHGSCVNVITFKIFTILVNISYNAESLSAYLFCSLRKVVFKRVGFHYSCKLVTFLFEAQAAEVYASISQTSGPWGIPFLD